jgi:integrase
MNWAEKMGHIDVNPIRRKLDKPPAGKRERVVTDEEYTFVLKKVSKAFGDLITTAWETGARPQEIRKVEARHVDLKNGRWVFPVQESKGKKYQRVVYLTDKALAITKRLMKKHPTGVLFRTHHGNPWSRHSISEAFGSLKERTKAPTKYRLYDFRHSFVTHGLKREVDPVTMATLAGHKDMKMIHEIYSHISQDPAHMRKMAKRAVG